MGPNSGLPDPGQLGPSHARCLYRCQMVVADQKTGLLRESRLRSATTSWGMCIGGQAHVAVNSGVRALAGDSVGIAADPDGMAVSSHSPPRGRRALRRSMHTALPLPAWCRRLLLASPWPGDSRRQESLPQNRLRRPRCGKQCQTPADDDSCNQPALRRRSPAGGYGQLEVRRPVVILG